MTTEHTPGPWIWGEDYEGLYGAGQDNIVLNYMPCENMWLAHSKHREANALLIAAAPDLLEALQDCAHCIYVECEDGMYTEEYTKAMKAINKALGQQ